VFFGEYQHSLDDKGRLIMPSKIRSALGEKFFATKGLDGCLFVYSEQQWALLEDELKNLSIGQTEARAFQRIFFAGAAELEFDKQGRVAIPQPLRDHARISKDVVVIGVSNRAEIWSRDKWDAYQDANTPDYEAIAEKIFQPRD
jgi:MraZ protein